VIELEIAPRSDLPWQYFGPFAVCPIERWCHNLAFRSLFNAFAKVWRQLVENNSSGKGW
jgi:hypothetical protein